ncbi:MAG: hypothetical protein U5R30_20760 [Deltaproteobacteria bacterium]|nr:hypothetical protein [Deltaproteobacteria bacterium]
MELGPGLVGRIFDGTQRPLSGTVQDRGPWVTRGGAMNGLDRNKVWAFTPRVGPGSQVQPGQVIGEVKETEAAIHRIMVPPNARKDEL